MNDNVVVVNEKDEVTGTISRAEAHEKGIPHRIAVVYVENPKGEILVQIRMTGRLDHSSAGHVDPGEEYIDTARRELKEELGMENIEINLVGHGVSEENVSGVDGHRIHVMQIFSCVGEPGELQKEEVCGVHWANPKEVLEEMLAKPTDMKFSGGFRVSLPIYLAKKL